ncbi:hypothetical protein [Wenzhouxiangella marina]|uniref:Uncharacterized protein n=1 Tax=Wenzhouxiangella marina TaxID=1579979 RepID=A0A0K0XX76_9GAMM|nr:hypothetical protein [Wenzhouxiangella marina]AKS42288.1 hypothetical protein WM2015_1922 [Wenzhouxiangella marina]MBB6085939.1 hypothetical protein [Wenzhouxiangella marina]
MGTYDTGQSERRATPASAGWHVARWSLGLLLSGCSLLAWSAAPCPSAGNAAIEINLAEATDRPDDALSCSSHGLADLSLNLIAGETRRILLELEQAAYVKGIYHLELRNADDQGVDWASITPSAGELMRGRSGRLALDISTPPGSILPATHALELFVLLHNGEQRWSMTLPIEVRVDEEQPLFRNRFEIDPVIGQFSQNDSSPAQHKQVGRARPSPTGEHRRTSWIGPAD